MKYFRDGMALGLVAALFASFSSAAFGAEKSFGEAYSIQVYEGPVLKWTGYLGADKEFINEKYKDDPKVAQCEDADVDCTWRANGSPFFYLERKAGLAPEFGLGRMYGITTYQTDGGQQKLSIPDIRYRGWYLPLDGKLTREFPIKGCSIGAADVTYRVIITKAVAEEEVDSP